MFAILVFFQLASPSGDVLLYMSNTPAMPIEECIASAHAFNSANSSSGAVSLCAPYFTV